LISICVEGGKEHKEADVYMSGGDEQICFNLEE
jgi:hypothetical protein